MRSIKFEMRESIDDIWDPLHRDLLAIDNGTRTNIDIWGEVLRGISSIADIEMISKIDGTLKQTLTQ